MPPQYFTDINKKNYSFAADINHFTSLKLHIENEKTAFSPYVAPYNEHCDGILPTISTSFRAFFDQKEGLSHQKR